MKDPDGQTFVLPRDTFMRVERVLVFVVECALANFALVSSEMESPVFQGPDSAQ
jgi:hypothetical protein